MKKNFVSLITFFTLLLVFTACEINRGGGNIDAKVISQSSCKYKKSLGTARAEIPDTLSCVEWVYSSSTQKLKLTHKNTVFNCCPGNLYCTVNQQGDTLVVEEYESQAACNCICLFDLDIEIENLENKTYLLTINEPYINKMEKIFFTLNLTQQPEGSYCITRKKYPYGI